MEVQGIGRAKFVTEPVHCRACENKCCKTPIISLNKLVRPCKCRPICEVCLTKQITNQFGSVAEGNPFNNYTCSSCTSSIFFKPGFQTSLIHLSQMSSHEKYTLFFLLIMMIGILIFGLVVLIRSANTPQRWIGITIFIVCVALIILILLPDMLNRFTHRFYERTRVGKVYHQFHEPSQVKLALEEGKYFQDLIEKDDIEGKV